MKKEAFKYPHGWEEREVVINDRTLFVPAFWDRYDSYSFPGWQDNAVFGRQAPVKVEYCSGNGEWISDRALNDPDSHWVAVEKRFDRARKIWARAKRMELKNLFLIFGEAHLVTKLYFPKNSVQEVYINFPDPWPKTKHAKHRLISPEFVQAVKEVLVPGGVITAASDDRETSLRMISHFHPECPSMFGAPYFRHELDGYGASFFETMWRGQGKEIFYHKFEKQ